MNDPLTAEELAALRKRVAYLVDSARDARECWIDADIWQRTLATIDTLESRLKDSDNERESAQRSSRRFFALSNVLLEEIDRINSCPRCERYADGYGEECERSGDSLEECSHEECCESGCEIVSFSPERINRACMVANDESKDATDVRDAGHE